MAGRKHHLQQAGITGKDLNKIENPFERDFAFRSMQATPYCKHCGEVVLTALQDKDKSTVNPEWEMANRAHYKCNQAWELDQEQKLLKARSEAEQKRKEAEANFDWERYMEDQLNKRSE